VLNKLFAVHLFIVANLFSNQALADYISDATAIKNSANLEANFNDGKVKDSIPAYNGSNAPQTSYYSNPSAMEDDSHLAANNSDNGKIAVSAFNNKGDYDLSYLPKDNSSTVDVSDVISLFTKPYSDCQPITTTTGSSSTIKTCDQYYQPSQNSCQVIRDIEVASSYIYSCTKDLTYTNKTCTQNLNVTATAGTLTESNFGNPFVITYPLIFSSSYIYGNSIYSSSYDGYCSRYSYYSSGQKIYLSFASNPSLNGIYTVSSSTCHNFSIGDIGGSIDNYQLILNENLGAGKYDSKITIKTKISDPTPNITSTWQEVCP
jgi:hypothetical protein